MRQIIEHSNGTMVYTKYATITQEDIVRVVEKLRELVSDHKGIAGEYRVIEIHGHMSKDQDKVISTFQVSEDINLNTNCEYLYGTPDDYPTRIQ